MLPQKIAGWVAGCVGIVGVLLAAFGLYGLTAFSVVQRTREIAIRMALGSSNAGVLWLVMRQAARLALDRRRDRHRRWPSSAAECCRACSSAWGRSIRVAFGGAIALLGSIMIAAAAVPARRAAHMDPMRALRSE